MIFLVLLSLFVFLLFLFVYIPLLLTAFYDAPYIPTGFRFIKKIFDFAELKPGEVFYDLGSGDGRLVRWAAKRGARATGIERSFLLVWMARLFWFFSWDKQGTALFKKGDFHKYDLSDADVIFCYLMPEAMIKLAPKFQQELKPGTRIVSRAFSLAWKPVKSVKFSRHSPKVYLYIK